MNLRVLILVTLAGLTIWTLAGLCIAGMLGWVP